MGWLLGSFKIHFIKIQLSFIILEKSIKFPLQHRFFLNLRTFLTVYIWTLRYALVTRYSRTLKKLLFGIQGVIGLPITGTFTSNNLITQAWRILGKIET